jgi:hypothetical protein
VLFLVSLSGMDVVHTKLGTCGVSRLFPRAHGYWVQGLPPGRFAQVVLEFTGASAATSEQGTDALFAQKNLLDLFTAQCAQSGGGQKKSFQSALLRPGLLGERPAGEERPGTGTLSRIAGGCMVALFFAAPMALMWRGGWALWIWSSSRRLR